MAEAPEPETIGKYKILGFLGQGAMGKVYKAHDPVLGREVAIKTISSIMASDPDLQKRFHREAQAAARLNHPNIITVYEYGEQGDTLYIAMELLEGTDLKASMDAGLLTTLSAKLRVADQVCDGLSFAHSKGVIHRDLKPANIWVSTTGQAKIMDFGLARIDSGDRSKAGMVVGTPNYMSPEQVMGDEIDHRTDIFSLGAVLYELLTNKKPFDSDSVHGILFQVVHKEPVPVRQLVKELPPIVAEVVAKALTKDRAQRFQSAAEFRDALLYVDHALNSGRSGEARLAKAGDSTFMKERRTTAPPVSPGASSSASDVVDGTVALDVKVPARKPAPRSGSTPAPTLRPAGPGSRTGPRSSPRVKRRSSVGPVVGLTFVVVLIAGAVLYRETLQDQYEKLVATPATPTPASPVDATTFLLVNTQIELARSKIDDKEYREALRVAETAVKLMPSSPEAREVRDNAQRIVGEIEAAATDASAAADAGDGERAGAALSQLLKLDPKHPVAVEVSAKLNASFRRQADEARQLAEDARKQAEKAGATKQAAFEGGAAAARQADAQLQKGSFADATRGFFEARDQFERARRAAQATPPPTAKAASTEAPARTPAEVAMATSPPALPSEPEMSAPSEPRRALVLGTNRVQSRRTGKGLAGFEDSDVSVQQATDLNGRIDIEFSPGAVRPGDSYSIRATFTNLGRKPVKIKESTISVRVNGGDPRVQPVTPESKEPGPNQTIRLAETGGVWESGVQSWLLEISVTSDKGEVCRRDLRLARN